MRAIALLGLKCGERNVAPFRLPGVEIAVADKVEPADAALIFGGDGTVHRHLESLHSLQVPALMVPEGSGNDFAHALGLKKPADSIEAWMRFLAGEGKIRSIDLGCIDPVSAGSQATRHLFCCVGGAGLDAAANRKANAMPRWLRRHGGYMLAAALAIMGKKHTNFRGYAEAANGEPVLDADEAAELVAFANAPAYGDGLLIAPGAKLDDGKLDIVYVRRASRFRLLSVAPTILRGTHIGLPEVWFARADKLKLESTPSRMIYADGEPTCETPVNVSVIRGGLRVIV